ncbi:MAG: hypothetical protein IKW46_08185 [Bacteroidaceae bacterium]|nr:hypothetical protein [Bacteroidaceae bacterium]
MKKLFERLKELYYGMLPWLLLIGVPIILCILIGIVFAGEEILQALTQLDKTYGSWLWGIILYLFGGVALFNLFIGFILTIEKISKKLSEKWIYIFIIVTAFGIFALTLLWKGAHSGIS